ncbi:hypothetical protein PoB_002748600 [Plakobranchus ocellatus]|uniref:Uncharacterized protein n=1 Tax=Plakobranchus ocellatus TaxID=259542 RepID=A0AAV3ZYI8_9GAST|nr:hypothetical protein PoB_002748600 [Plakobranchus ocellatus]
MAEAATNQPDCEKVVLMTLEITITHKRPKSRKIVLCRFCATLPPLIEVVIGPERVDRGLKGALYSRTELIVTGSRDSVNHGLGREDSSSLKAQDIK